MSPVFERRAWKIMSSKEELQHQPLFRGLDQYGSKMLRGGFVEAPMLSGKPNGFMGMGLIKMASSLHAGRTRGATGVRALHALEVHSAILKTGTRGGVFFDIATSDEGLSLAQISRGAA